MTKFWFTMFRTLTWGNITHSSKNKLNLKPVVTNIYIGKRNWCWFLDHFIWTPDFFLSRTMATVWRNQTPSSFNRQGNLLAQISEKSGVRPNFSHGQSQGATLSLPLASFTDRLSCKWSKMAEVCTTPHPEDPHQVSLTT